MDGTLPVDGTVTVRPAADAPGLLLRPWRVQDIPALVAAHRDPVIQRWLRHRITSEAEAREVIETGQADRRAGNRFSFAVVETGADGAASDLVGSVVIRGLGDEAVSGEVGYWVVSRARGRGTAPRALNAACEWAFRLPRSHPLERLELIHAVGNQASCRVADKAGFALSAVIPPLPPQFPQDGHLHIRPSDRI